MLSFWETETYFNNIDVAIIGSGIVGLNAAMNLKLTLPALKIIVLERGFLPSGASTKNAGFACFGSPSELLDDLKTSSEDKVFSLVEKRWKGLARLRHHLGDDKIDFRQWGGYELFTDDEYYRECEEQLDYLNHKLSDIIPEKEVYKIASDKISTFGFNSVKHLVLNTAEGQIHTGMMMAALTQRVQELGVIILNSIKINQFENDNGQVNIVTDKGFSFRAKKLLSAVNGFAQELLPECEVFPARAQVLLTSPIADLKLQGTFHFDRGYYYFRNIGDRVLFGGGRNLDFSVEQTSEFGLTSIIQDKLEYYLQTMILPNSKYQIESRWSGIMGIGKSDKTFIVKKVRENIFCAVRMGGMGIAVGSLVGEEAAALIAQELS
jgi:gamma-glutamylputrescine oxidase